MICRDIIQDWMLSQWMYVSNVIYCHVINNGILEKSHSRVQEHPFCIMPSQQKIIQCVKNKMWFLTIKVSLHLPDSLQWSFLCIFFYFSANKNLVLTLSSTSSKHRTKAVFLSTRDFAINTETQQHKLTSEQFRTERCSSTCW